MNIETITLTSFYLNVKEDEDNPHMTEQWYEDVGIAPPTLTDEDFEEVCRKVKIDRKKILYYIEGEDDIKTSTIYRINRRIRTINKYTQKWNTTITQLAWQKVSFI